MRARDLRGRRRQVRRRDAVPLRRARVQRDPVLRGGGAPAPPPLAREVAPGSHTVVIEAIGYAPYTVKTVAVPDEMVPVEGKLVAKPAILSVHAPSGAHVAIDGRTLGGALDRLEVA